MVRPTEDVARRDPDKPQGPSNPMVFCPFIKNVLDLRWDDPNSLLHNISGNFIIAGVNIYRAQTESGPYVQINSSPVQTTSYRDILGPVYVDREDVSGSFLSRGTNRNGEWIFYVAHPGIVSPTKPEALSVSPTQVKVYIDGVEVPARRVVSRDGEIYLHHESYFDVASGGKEITPLLPGPSSLVQVSYYYTPTLIPTNLQQRIFYKITSVDTSGKETPLDQVSAVTQQNVETMGYIWKRATSMNLWILEQGGERALAFVRKTSGVPCRSCFDNPEISQVYFQSKHDCPVCYGTGFEGGYIGPIPIILAPKEGERAIELGPQGLHMNFSWSTWTTNFPLLQRRDFIRTQAGEIYAIGPVDRKEHRGLILQQHFTLSAIDSTDMRYRFPVDGYVPLVTSKPTIDDAIEIRGRTFAFEDINY